MSGLRPFLETDAAPVADLIWRVLHGHTGPAPVSLHSHLKDLFLSNPWMDEGIVSRLFEDSQGKLIGFFGAVPRRMSVKGRTIRLAFGSNFVVDPESRTSMVALQLVRAFMKGSQDISITDSANEMSQPLLRSMGFTVVPVYSLQWMRPLKPLQFGLNTWARMRQDAATRVFASIAKPICGFGDAIATRLPGSPFVRQRPTTTSEEPDTSTLIQCLAEIPSRHWLVPEYDQESLEWVLDFITKRKVLGNIRKKVVRDGTGRLIGWYVFSVPQHGIGDVLQIGALSSAVGAVLDHMFYDAGKQNLVGLQGRMEPQFMQELTSKGCFFFRHGSWTLAHSLNHPDLVSMLQSGTAFFSRLDGEWCLRHGGSEIDQAPPA